MDAQLEPHRRGPAERRGRASFEEFYLRHVDTVLGYFVRRTGDAELAADLASETFAAALAGRRRYRPRKGAAASWLFGIASRKLADAQRKGYAERRMFRKLGMERIDLTDADIAHIEALGESGALLEGLPSDQEFAVRAPWSRDAAAARSPGSLQTSEAVVRKRVGRGLATARRRIGRHE